MNRLLLIVMILPLKALSQSPADNLMWQLESGAGSEKNQPTLELTGEQAGQLSSNPIRINFASAEDLMRLMLLDIFQISNLIQYREKTGPIYTHFELRVIKGFDRELIERLLPYLDFSTEPVLPSFNLRDLKRARHELILRYQQTLQKREGFKRNDERAYLGPGFGSYLRYRGNFRDLIHIGLALQNDAGEPLGGNHNPVMADHASGFLALTNIGPLEQFTLGDFHVSYGQGVGFWTGGGISGSGDFSQIKRYPRGVHFYAGSEETRYLRGCAVRLRLPHQIRVEGFLSSRNIDARIVKDSLSEFSGGGGTLLNTGLHRTADEIRSKNNNHLNVVGGRIAWRKNQFAAGAYLAEYKFAKNVPLTDDLYSKYRFAGSGLTTFGLELHYFWRRYNIFAEASFDQDANVAFVAGMESLLADGFTMAISLRHFDTKYRSFYTSPPATRGSSGEQGIYLGLDWELSAHCQLAISVDHYMLAWPSYQLDAPGEGSAARLIFRIPVSRYWQINLGGWIRRDAQNLDNDNPMKSISPRRRTNLRAEMRYQLNKTSRMVWRMEKSWVQSESISSGFLLYQDYNKELQGGKINMNLRLALVDIPDYASRIYAYEADLLYSFSIPAYHGRAFKSYLKLRCHLGQKTSIEGKISFSRFYDRDQIGSGLQTIDGNIICDSSVQVRFKL